MKRALLFLSLASALVFVPALRAEVSAISVRAEQISKDENSKFTKTQVKTLKIILNNSSAQDVDGLLVKYYFFGKAVNDHDVVILDKGEKAASVKAHGSEIVESASMTAKSTEAHQTGSPNGKKKGGKGGAAPKKVAASGEKVTGYGVQVLDKGKVVAEYFSAPSLKQEVGGSR